MKGYIILFIKKCQGDEVKKDKMGGACACIKQLRDGYKFQPEKDHFGGVRLHGRRILKQILKTGRKLTVFT
jgi:hypothetical protein